LTFGQNAPDVLALLQSVLGAPDGDTGWRSDQHCSGSETRRLTWGDLEVVFTGMETSGGTALKRTFEQWFVNEPGTLPPGLVTLDRVGIGSTVADLKYAYPSLEISHPRQGDKMGLFTTKSGNDNLIAGFTTDTTDASTVFQMWAGGACQRLADSD
jgi:hypothetical protein